MNKQITHRLSKVNGKPHGWSFVRDGDEKGLITCEVEEDGHKEHAQAILKVGMKDLLGGDLNVLIFLVFPDFLLVVLKTGGSAFEGFYRDENTTLSGKYSSVSH